VPNQLARNYEQELNALLQRVAPALSANVSADLGPEGRRAFDPEGLNSFLSQLSEFDSRMNQVHACALS
jgi:hypothetical protein